MKALVSTDTLLLLVDLESHQVVPLALGAPRYWGISWFPGTSSLVLTRDPVTLPHPPDLEEYAHTEQATLDLHGYSSPPMLSFPGQVLCAPDGRVLVANRGRNALEVFDPAAPEVRCEVHLPHGAPRWAITGDSGICSLALQGDRVHVLAARAEVLVTLSYPDLEVVGSTSLPGPGLANIWTTDEGTAITCDGALHGLRDLTSGLPLWRTHDRLRPRGLAATADLVVVGATDARPDPEVGQSGLYLLDRHDWTATDFIWLPGVGAVRDVRLVDVADQAHHGCPLTDPAGLGGHPLAGTISAEKLRHARITADLQERWHTVLGDPAPGRPGGGLAVVTVADAGSPEGITVTADYRLVSDLATAATVIAGPGITADADSDAFLVCVTQPGAGDRRCARLQHWRHRGRWELVMSFALPLARAGTLSMTVTGPDVVLVVDDQPVARVPRATLGHPQGTPGLRWVEAAMDGMAWWRAPATVEVTG